MNSKVKKSDLNKAWNLHKLSKKPYRNNYITPEKTFLIVCEGENTEPEYFKAFPVVSADIKVYRAGKVRTSLIQEAMRLGKNEENEGREIWCVFDYDDQSDNAEIATDFESAINLANKNNILLAWSNDSIELWFILHYQYFTIQTTRHNYYPILTKRWKLRHSYENMGKQKDFCSTLYKQLLPDQSKAIVNAKRLFEDQSNIFPISKRNPCTLVFSLVEELNKYLRQ